MAIYLFDQLDENNYLQNDGSIPQAVSPDATELTIASGEASQGLDLAGFSKISVVYESNLSTEITFLELVGNQTAVGAISIVEDPTYSPSSGYALKIEGACTLVFGTRISYVPTILKKIVCKARKDSGNAGTDYLYAGVQAYANGQLLDTASAVGLGHVNPVFDTNQLVDVTRSNPSGSAMSATSYGTGIGYIKGLDSSFVEPAPYADTPSALPLTTDEVALVLQVTGGTFFIDLISLEEVENSIRDIPDGNGVYTSAQNFDTRNDRLSTVPANPVVTTPSSYTLNGDGSIDLTVDWTHAGAGDAYNIDGFAVFSSGIDDTTDLATGATENSAPVFVDDGSGQDSDYIYTNVDTTSITDGVQKSTAIAQYGNIEFSFTSILTGGHKYAFICQAKTSSGNVRIVLDDDVQAYADEVFTNDGTWQTVGLLYTTDVTATNVSAYLMDYGVSSWAEMQTKEWMVLDVTALGDTALTVDALIDKYYRYPFVAVDEALYVDSDTRSYTLHGITINSYWNFGVQAYRVVDPDINANEILKSAIAITAPYQPANITPSTTTYAIQSNVDGYLGGVSNGSAFLHGYYPNGIIGNIAGQIKYVSGTSSIWLAVPNALVDCTDFTFTANKTFTCYLVVDTGGATVLPAFYNILTGKLTNDTADVTTGLAIGELTIDYTHIGTGFVITNAIAYNEGKTVDKAIAEQNIYALNYLAESDGSSADFAIRAEALGIEDAFFNLAAYNAFIVNLFTQDATVLGAIHSDGVDSYGDATSGWWIGDDSGTAKLQIGSLAGNHIKWDGTNLSGNVAYDEWDLVIQSDADLALLHARTAWITATAYVIGDKITNDAVASNFKAYICIANHTSGDTDDEPGVGATTATYWTQITYSRVLVTKGTWATTVQIDLNAYSVETFEGLSNSSTIDLLFELSDYGFFVGVEGNTISNFSIISTYASQTSTTAYIIDASTISKLEITNISISGFDDKCIGIFGVVDSGLFIDKCIVTECYDGFDTCWRMQQCTAHANAHDGIKNSVNISSCYSYANGNKGFTSCDAISSCFADNNTGIGFIGCRYISSCASRLNNVGLSGCTDISSSYSGHNTTYGLTQCTRISSTFSSSNGTNWNQCVDIDYDSTNCDQTFGYGYYDISASSTWIPPIGTYTFAYEQYLRPEILHTGTWRGNNGSWGGSFISDGVNTRIRNTNVFTTIRAYYRKKP